MKIRTANAAKDRASNRRKKVSLNPKVEDPKFPPKTVLLLASRSGHICNNPKCATITIGPVGEHHVFAAKVGEAAHIHSAQSDGPRWRSDLTPQQRAAYENGIWLCASCHTMIDKNNGKATKAELLHEWKSEHEKLIQSLLESHRSPLPYLRSATDDGRLVRRIIEKLELRGAMFMEADYEVPQYVERSIEDLRNELLNTSSKVQFDNNLLGLITKLADACRNYMNKTGAHPNTCHDELKILRNRIGVLLAKLCRDYACTVRGELSRILPKSLSST